MVRFRVEFDEQPTGRQALAAAQWRLLLRAFDKLGDAERDRLIAHVARWAELDADARVLVEAIALRLRG